MYTRRGWMWLVAGGLLVASAYGEDWPQFRGPRRDNISAETGLLRQWPEGGPKVLWSVEVCEGYAGPAIFGGRVYFEDYDREGKQWLLRCVSLADGKEQWRCTDAKTIRPNHGITRAVPATDGQRVFALDPKCIFHCVDAQTGKELWRKDLVDDYKAQIPSWYNGQCPLLDGDRVILGVGGDDALMIAFEPATGREIWRTPNPEKWPLSHSSVMPATLGGVKQYLWCTLRGPLGVRASDGRLLWQHAYKFNLAVAPSPLAVGDDQVFMTAGYDAGTVMVRVRPDGDDRFRTESVFELTAEQWNAEVHTPILYQDHLFAVGRKQRGLLTCLDSRGKAVWTSADRASFGLGSLLLADGMLFVLEGDSGMLRLIEASTSEYKELDHAQVLSGHDVWGPMGLSDGRLVLRDMSKMICIEVAPPRAAGNTDAPTAVAAVSQGARAAAAAVGPGHIVRDRPGRVFLAPKGPTMIARGEAPGCAGPLHGLRPNGASGAQLPRFVRHVGAGGTSGLAIQGLRPWLSSPAPLGPSTNPVQVSRTFFVQPQRGYGKAAERTGQRPMLPGPGNQSQAASSRCEEPHVAAADAEPTTGEAATREAPRGKPSPRQYRRSSVIDLRGEGLGQLQRELRGLAIDAAGRLYAVGDSRVTALSPTGTVLGSWSTNRPGFAVATAADGAVWIGEEGQIEIFDRDGKLRRRWTDAERLRLVTAIGFMDGGVLAADVSGRCLRRFDGDGLFERDIGREKGKRGFMLPNGFLDFAVDPSGKTIFAVNPGQHRIERYSAAGAMLGSFGRFGEADAAGFPGCCNPTNIAVAPDGTLVVSEKAPPRLKAYNVAGELLAVWGTEDFDPDSRNIDLAVDSEGRVYAADTARLRIVVYEPAVPATSPSQEKQP